MAVLRVAVFRVAFFYNLFEKFSVNVKKLSNENCMIHFSIFFLPKLNTMSVPDLKKKRVFDPTEGTLRSCDDSNQIGKNKSFGICQCWEVILMQTLLSTHPFF